MECRFTFESRGTHKEWCKSLMVSKRELPHEKISQILIYARQKYGLKPNSICNTMACLFQRLLFIPKKKALQPKRRLKGGIQKNILERFRLKVKV